MDSQTHSLIEARFLRRGDTLRGNPIPNTSRERRRIIKRVTARKSDDTVRIIWLDDTEERVAARAEFEVLRRDTLTFPTGPGSRAWGRG